MTTQFSLLTRHVLAACAIGACMASPLAFGASGAGPSDADIGARYKADVQRCNSGDTNQDRATCIREAGAALEEARHNRLIEGNPNYEQDKTARCQALPTAERDDCLLQMSGKDTVVEGSVGGGGVLRETTIVTPGKVTPGTEITPVVPLGEQRIGPPPVNPEMPLPGSSTLNPVAPAVPLK